MTKREWVALGFITAAFISIGIILAIAEPEALAKEILVTGMPAWLQGIGTVVAAIVGYAAYRNWTRQEILKGRASDAKVILQQTHTLAKRLRVLRSVHGTYSLPPKLEQLKRATTSQRRELARASNVAAATLSDSVEMARELFDDELGNDLLELIQLESAVTGAIPYIDDLIGDAAGEMDPQWNDDAVREMRLLGFKEVQRSRSKDSFVRSDVHETKLSHLVKQISDKLRIHIHYGETSPNPMA